MTERPIAIAVCVDCADLLANGEAHTWDKAEYRDISQEIQTRISEHWGDTQITLGSVTDTADTETETWFSSSACEACGSHLAGDRFDAVAWNRESEQTETTLFNSEEFCPDCERETPSHYDSCPRKGKGITPLGWY